ncbi:MAG: hypothetical protein GY796_05085, partial [Chloroflexi bacterium]|nr:hypothetical protein [Chloroflexota bacterium]
ATAFKMAERLPLLRLTSAPAAASGVSELIEGGIPKLLTTPSVAEAGFPTSVLSACP